MSAHQKSSVNSDIQEKGWMNLKKKAGEITQLSN